MLYTIRSHIHKTHSNAVIMSDGSVRFGTKNCAMINDCLVCSLTLS